MFRFILIISIIICSCQKNKAEDLTVTAVPAGGSFTTIPLTVKIEASDSDATVYYRIIETSAKVTTQNQPFLIYQDPISIENSSTLEFYAEETVKEKSNVPGVNKKNTITSPQLSVKYTLTASTETTTTASTTTTSTSTATSNTTVSTSASTSIPTPTPTPTPTPILTPTPTPTPILTPTPTYNVTYNGNSNTSGTVPTDPTSYQSGQSVTVLGNSGNLTNTVLIFSGWTTSPYGNGTTYTQGQTFNIGSANVIFYAKWNCATTCYYDDSSAIAAGTATTPLGKVIDYAYANGSSGFKVWKEHGGNRVLRANGSDEWAQSLNLDGRGQSGSDFTDTNIGTANTLITGRACPTNVYIDDNNKFTIGNCVYYTPTYASQTLNAAGTSQNVSGSIGLSSWSSASWYVGNIQTCASKGMRLPTMFEYQKGMDRCSGFTPQSDGTPTFTDNLGIPATWTWSATSSTDNHTYYCCGYGNRTNYDMANIIGVVCVLP